MELPLVVGVDGSGFGLMAVDWAVDEAARHGLPLRLVHASLWERYEGATASSDPQPATEKDMAEKIVASAAERARRRDPAVRLSTDILPEEAVTALLREGSRAFALVTGTRGRSELTGLLLGSVSLAVAARAPCPVIVVRGDRTGLAGDHDRILLGAGEPDTGGEAVRFAFREAEVRKCVLDVVRAWHRPAYESTDLAVSTAEAAHRHEQEAADHLDALLRQAMTDHPTVRVRPATAEGPTRTVLVKRSAAADLVVIGSRPVHSHLGLRLGRVGHTLLHHAQCPVAVVPQGE
ncbi:universal stress protein [Streptomyces sp. RY43-2]|uniref:Universal stress protein n=1 Tax=Streptomyces macrolidinus TaxID=2952607 RepID=A0ABT0ZF69_9ACTN|nr:universal stress protein [Streptomyces macrolidinus]MCN9242218.1 universal stress protein [Streptomyces macrolidinus]